MNIKDEVTDKYSLRGRVYSKIRADILEGRYKNNDELRELAIGEELGVSRTPVREAFRQLELEGLIRIVPNKGAYVTGITAKDVKDIYMIRSKLEGLAARWAVDNITNEHRKIMEAIKSGDKDLAEETATNHIRNAYSNIVANGLKESYPEE